MASVLMAVTGADFWTFADGEKHPCGYWPEEVAVPHQVFTAAGLDVTIATPAGVKPTADEAGFSPEMNGGSAEAGEALRSYLTSIDEELSSAAVLENLDATGFDIVFIPGGHGPMEDLATSTSFGAQLRAAHDAGRIISAVCHGPAGLLAAKNDDGTWLFSGHEVTGFTNVEEGQVGYATRAAWLLEDRLNELGGKFQANEAWAPLVVVDRQLYTGQNPASSKEISERLVAAVGG